MKKKNLYNNKMVSYLQRFYDAQLQPKLLVSNINTFPYKIPQEM